MIRTKLEIRLKHLRTEVSDLICKVESAYRKTMLKPNYDSYAEVSAVVGDLRGLLDAIVGKPNLQQLQIEVFDLLGKVEPIQRKILQDFSYSNPEGLTIIIEQLEALYDNLGEEIRLEAQRIELV